MPPLHPPARLQGGDRADTAGAARHISETNDLTRGALAPKLAATIYGLDVLAENVEDEAHNTTRFVILSRDSAHAPRGNGRW